MTENSLITLYCIVDDFIHRFLETSAGKRRLKMIALRAYHDGQAFIPLEKSFFKINSLQLL